MALYLHGVGHYHPDNEITNRFLEELDIGTNDAWIMARVGIRTRRTVLPLDYIRQTRNRDPRAAVDAAVCSNAEMAARAAELALSRAGITARDVGLVISGSCAPDTVTPAEACTVAERLGITAPALDVNSACTSFGAAVDLLARMREDALPPYVLVTTPEGMTRTVNYTDRNTAVLWGDAASAAVFSTRVPGRATVLGANLMSNPADWRKVQVPRIGFFKQDGAAVQKFAIKMTREGFVALRDQYGAAGRTLHFIGHQANLRMLESVCTYCDIDPARHHYNVDGFGNTGSAGAPTVLSQRWDLWTDADDIAMVGVGAGLTWSRYLIRFGRAAG